MKYVKLYESFNNEPIVKKGQKVNVKLEYLQNQPVSEVTAHNDAFLNENNGEYTFPFLFGGDMMMLARYNKEGGYWYSK